jgi:hypothetical protein
MINLIPTEERKKMTVDFYLRFVVVFLLLGSFTVFVACLAILPAYFLSSEKNKVVDLKLAVQKNEPMPLFGEQYLATVKDVNNKLGLVENAEKNKFIISEKVVSAILLKKSPGVKITQLIYGNDTVGGRKINIIGTAATRDSLLSFRRALEDDDAFKNVDLPISNFVKDTNIQFNLSLSPS